MNAIEPKILGAVVFGLLALLLLGILLIRSGLKASRRRATPEHGVTQAVVVHDSVTPGVVPDLAPEGVPLLDPTPDVASPDEPRPSAPPPALAARAPAAPPSTPLLVPGPTVLPADDAVIDLRVSFDDTASQSAAAAGPATDVSVVVTNGDPSVLLRSVASELAKRGYYLRPERPLDGWLSSVHDRRQNRVGELSAAKNDAAASTIKLSMRDYGSSLELVDRAIVASGYALLTRDRVQDRQQYSYLDESGARVRATLTEVTDQTTRNG